MRRRAAALLVVIAALASCEARPRLVLGSTHTLEDSGLLPVITRAFQEAHPDHRLAAVVAGSGEILAMARNGDVDVLLTHSPEDEMAFIASGYGAARHEVMYNDFVVLGPAADPARAAAAGNAALALRAVQDAGALFISRGDDSGTHRRERALWAGAQTVPDWNGYVEAGTGMAEALRLAHQRGAYILADRATWEKLKAELAQLRIVHEGDARLRNQYSVIVVTNTDNPAGAQLFAEWMRGAGAQQLVQEFGLDSNGRPLFRGNAR